MFFEKKREDGLTLPYLYFVKILFLFAQPARASVFCLLFFACYLRHLEAYYLRALVFKKGFSLFSIVLNASWGFFEEIFEDTLENFEKNGSTRKGFALF